MIKLNSKIKKIITSKLLDHLGESYFICLTLNFIEEEGTECNGISLRLYHGDIEKYFISGSDDSLYIDIDDYENYNHLSNLKENSKELRNIFKDYTKFLNKLNINNIIYKISDGY
jgi:hypothetical protein